MGMVNAQGGLRQQWNQSRMRGLFPVAGPTVGRCNAPHEFLSIRSDRRSEEHTSELQSLRHIVCRLLLDIKKRELAAGGILHLWLGVTRLVLSPEPDANTAGCRMARHDFYTTAAMPRAIPELVR